MPECLKNVLKILAFNTIIPFGRIFLKKKSSELPKRRWDIAISLLLLHIYQRTEVLGLKKLNHISCLDRI